MFSVLFEFINYVCLFAQAQCVDSWRRQYSENESEGEERGEGEEGKARVVMLNEDGRTRFHQI